jgi:hypothetical protein
VTARTAEFDGTSFVDDIDAAGIAVGKRVLVMEVTRCHVGRTRRTVSRWTTPLTQRDTQMAEVERRQHCPWMDDPDLLAQWLAHQHH